MNNVTNVLVAFVLVRLTGLFLSKKKRRSVQLETWNTIVYLGFSNWVDFTVKLNK